ncbi:MAG: hypothetical protein WAQ05_00660 [Rubrivivax sp.]
MTNRSHPRLFYVTVKCTVVALAAGCASPPPRPIGAVLPMAGGNYQSTVKAADPEQALKAFRYDAEITCGDGQPARRRMFWEAAPPPPKFTVVSQSLKDKSGKEVKSGNQLLDAGIAVGLKRLGLEQQDSVTATTVFKCG